MPRAATVRCSSLTELANARAQTYFVERLEGQLHESPELTLKAGEDLSYITLSSLGARLFSWPGFPRICPKVRSLC